MDSNPFLSYFGLDGDDYYPADPEPTDTDKGKGWHLKERRMRVPCPFCGCYDYVVVHSHYTRVIDMEQGAATLPSQLLHRIDIFAASIVTMPWITFRVFGRQNAGHIFADLA